MNKGKMYPVEEALKAQRSLRDAAGLEPEQFPIRAFVGMISDEIESLRKRIQEALRYYNDLTIGANRQHEGAFQEGSSVLRRSLALLALAHRFAYESLCSQQSYVAIGVRVVRIKFRGKLTANPEHAANPTFHAVRAMRLAR
jgi:hypothetical protein